MITRFTLLDLSNWPGGLVCSSLQFNSLIHVERLFVWRAIGENSRTYMELKLKTSDGTKISKKYGV